MGGSVRTESLVASAPSPRRRLDQKRWIANLLTDLSNLKSMDASCASEVGAIMELCCSHGLAVLKRVIPDRSKDIGFNVISCFHLDPQIKTQTYENLAEAISSLLSEPLESVSKDVDLV